MSENSPIFVRGYSRSGGTLMVTILDAHPQIAMSYELYPNLLTSLNDSEMNLDNVRQTLKKARNIRSAGKKIKDAGFRNFVLRCVRGGLDNHDIAQLIEKHLAEGNSFSNDQGRLKFIEKCCMQKMNNEHKSLWGLKCNNQYDEYVSVWPGAYFINVIRDGRDVLASQLKTGSFNKTPEEVGKGWVNTHFKFRKLVERPDVNTYEVFYEKLVSQPEDEINNICDFLRVPFHKSMLNFHKQDLTIYAQRSGHLSAKRISKPIDSSKVGRWTKDLKKKQIEEFYSVARDAMIEFGYLKGSDAD